MHSAHTIFHIQQERSSENAKGIKARPGGRRFVPDPIRGAYSALPDRLVGFKGAASRQEENGGEGRTRGREEKGEWGREGKGESWGIAPWLLGDRHPTFYWLDVISNIQTKVLTCRRNNAEKEKFCINSEPK